MKTQKPTDLQEDFNKNMRFLASALKLNYDDRSSKKYSQRALPPYQELLSKLIPMFQKAIQTAPFIGDDLKGIWEFQSVAVVATQILLPPMRGKPFWDLYIDDIPQKSKFCQFKWLAISPFPQTFASALMEN